VGWALLYARHNLGKYAGSLRVTGLHENARYPDYEHDHGQYYDEAFGLAHATRIAPARSPKPWPGGSLLHRTSENSIKAKFAEFYKGEVRRIPIPRTPVNKG
jgi:hypothetical protein